MQETGRKLTGPTESALNNRMHHPTLDNRRFLETAIAGKTCLNTTGDV